MIKNVKVRFDGKDIEITKLAASQALKAHAKMVRFVAPAISDITSSIGKSDEEQNAGFTKAITAAFENPDMVDELTDFIDKHLTSGHVIFDGQRVQHLDDLDRFEDIDGSEVMYFIFIEWVKLNMGSLLKKIGGSLAG